LRLCFGGVFSFYIVSSLQAIVYRKEFFFQKFILESLNSNLGFMILSYLIGSFGQYNIHLKVWKVFHWYLGFCKRIFLLLGNWRRFSLNPFKDDVPSPRYWCQKWSDSQINRCITTLLLFFQITWTQWVPRPSTLKFRYSTVPVSVISTIYGGHYCTLGPVNFTEDCQNVSETPYYHGRLRCDITEPLCILQWR